MRPILENNDLMPDDPDHEPLAAARPATAGELKLSDLPPIENLTISVPVENLVKIGKVLSIVEVLVVIESIRSMPPLDLDTVLFKSDGTTIGQIFDTFGTVTEPHYSVRFTNVEQIKERGIELGQDIFFSPRTERVITKFAFVNELRKIKGTDASWEHDNERPPTIDPGEYSDDEQERQARRQRKNSRTSHNKSKEQPEMNSELVNQENREDAANESEPESDEDGDTHP